MKKPFLLVCGPRGVGKSSVGWQVFFDVMQSGVTSAHVDLVQVSWFRPAPEDDPDNHRVKVQNLARLWSVYEQAGARCLVATGDVRHRESWTPTPQQSHRLPWTSANSTRTPAPLGGGCLPAVGVRDHFLLTSCEGKARRCLRALLRRPQVHPTTRNVKPSATCMS